MCTWLHISHYRCYIKNARETRYWESALKVAKGNNSGYCGCKITSTLFEIQKQIYWLHRSSLSHERVVHNIIQSSLKFIIFVLNVLRCREYLTKYKEKYFLNLCSLILKCDQICSAQFLCHSLVVSDCNLGPQTSCTK
jgi:hypothetical protein